MAGMFSVASGLSRGLLAGLPLPSDAALAPDGLLQLLMRAHSLRQGTREVGYAAVTTPLGVSPCWMVWTEMGFAQRAAFPPRELAVAASGASSDSRPAGRQQQQQKQQ
jgi:hypothetical protein